ncbi:type II secretion system F family protein [Methanocella arvoryzae]|uniref:Bacterial type II secretion system protein n=1 Tax=Methanocella arvoryzae (strain DSM 22066 / NBRC 105507 / MRE50) TaxID=351160 RepID=Q0W2Q8_METAR|nr:type II secretion system F family protein [Methanocella arvoryzae]CAJ37335.1 putative bacterial type II secretion system protein [Methanocella arvoryzae MRE50]
MDEFSQIAHVIFGPEVKKRKDRYYQLQKQLRQAHMAQSYEVYVSVAYLSSVIAAIVGAMLGLIIGFLLRGVIIDAVGATNLHMPQSMSWIFPFAGIIVLLVTTILAGALGGIITFSTFMLIPSFNASDRKSRINKGLPSAVTFMYAMSKGGADIITILRSLYEAETTYGEVSREIGFVIRDMDYFGNDLRAALINCANQTPSDLLQDLLSNLLSVIDSGGDVTTYLNNKVEQYRMRIALDQKSFLEILGLIAESYVTCFVAGPLFIIIMSSVMTIMNGGSPMILYIIIYAVLPLGSVIFIVMISMMTPQDDETPRPFEVQVISQYDMLPENAADANTEKKRTAELQKARENLKFKQFTRNPLEWVKKDPINALAISVPVAIIFVLLLIGLTFGNMTQAFADVATFQKDLAMGKAEWTTDPLIIYGPIIGYFDDLIVYFLIISLTPLALFHESKNMRERKIASEMPDFLKKLASTNETGMTLTQSINLIANSNFGTLSKEVQKIHKDLQWGTDVSTALKRFANSLRTSSSTRVITLITKASESSGDIKDVLNIAANDARANELMRKERFDGMLIYVVIIFISFLVFLYCVYTLTSSFIPVMASAAGSATAAATSSAARATASQATFIKAFNPDDYVRLFFHAALIQGLFAGLLAGQMGEGKWMSGLKYSLIMLVVAYVIFTVFI